MADTPEYDFSGLDEAGSAGQTPSIIPSANAAEAAPKAESGEQYDFSGIDKPDEDQALQDKYGGVGEQIKAGAEGLAEGFAGPLAPLAETTLGISTPEAIRGRAEAHPWTHGVTGVGGLVGSTLAGVGLGSALTKIGGVAKVGAATLGLGKVGSAVAVGALENAAFQAQDEISKLVLSDPNQSAESAVASMGLATLLGGGVGGIASGVVSPLWTATMGSKTGGLLKAVAQKMGGIENVTPEVDELLAKTGIDTPGEIRATLSKSPEMRAWAKTFEQSNLSKSATKYQKAMTDFRKQGGDMVASTLGKTPEEVEALGSEGISKYNTGKDIGHTLASEYQETLNPISKAFDDIHSKYSDLELSSDIKLPDGTTAMPGTASQISDKIGKLAMDQGWTASPSSDIMHEVNRVLKELPLQKNVKNLSDFITQVGNNMSKDPMNGSLMRAGRMIKGILKDAESDLIAARVGQTEGAEAVAAYQSARAAYREQSALKDALNDRLHIRGANTSNFAKALKEMAQSDGEAVLNRLSGKGDADLLNFLQTNYPKTAQAVKDYHINDLLKVGADKAKDGMTINTEAVLKKLNAMSPELKSFVLQGKNVEQLKAIGEVLGKLNEMPHNYSNTATTLADRFIHLPATAVGMVAAIISHSPVLGAVLGPLTKYLSIDAPDAAKLALMKWIGTSKAINPEALKATADMIQHTIKATDALNRAASNVFKAGKEILPSRMIPSESTNRALDKTLKSLQNDPTKLQNVGGKAAYYMPDHGEAMARLAASATQYLNSKRPTPIQQSPLDTKQQPTPAQQNAYNRILSLANQPMQILHNVKEGSLLPSDIETVKTVYPNLYNRLCDKLSSSMAQAVSDGTPIPYKTKMGISLMLGQPMDSTMAPNSIQTIMQMGQVKQQQNQEAVAQSQGGRPSSPALNKVSGAYRTPGQAAEQRRIMHK